MTVTVIQNVPKISPHGVEMPQLSAALMSTLESVKWFVLHPSFFVLDKLKSISDCQGVHDMETDEIGENHEIPHDLEEEGDLTCLMTIWSRRIPVYMY